MYITVLFTNQKYRQYLTVWQFINDLRKQKWGDLDIHEIMWEKSSYDLSRFLYIVTLDKVKTDFLAILDETTYRIVTDLLERLLSAGEDGTRLLRNTLLYILENEVFMTCGDEEFDENLEKLEQIKEYLDCFYFERG